MMMIYYYFYFKFQRIVGGEITDAIYELDKDSTYYFIYEKCF